MSDEDNRQLKNAIFDARRAVEGAGGVAPMPGQPEMHDRPEVTREEYVKRELGFEIPVDLVPLPSAGKVYPYGHGLHRKDRVEFRAMTAKEEDILMSRAFIKKGTVITELIKSCLWTRDVKVEDMISGDRNALMIAIRVSGYGADYNLQYTCPSCNTNNEVTADLTELPIKPLSIEPVEPYENLFHFKLPVSKKVVGFKFLTGEEEEEIIKNMEAKKKRGLLNDNVVTTRLLHSIVEIDGNRDRNAISKFIQFMPARDSLELRRYIDENEPGVDMTFDFSCVHCDYSQQSQLPIGPTFFWPNARR